MKATFLLYHYGRLIAEIKCSRHYTDNMVRGAAIAAHERAPTVFADYPEVAPFEHRNRLQYAVVLKDSKQDFMDWYCK